MGGGDDITVKYKFKASFQNSELNWVSELSAVEK